MISIIARLPMKENKEEEAIAAIRELMDGVANEEGTVLYTLSRDPKNPNMLIFIERYKDKESVNAHSATPHFKAFFAKGATFLAGRPEITIMEEILSAK